MTRTAYITTQGDESMGIMPMRIDIDLHIDFADVYDRINARVNLAECFSEIYSDIVVVIFDDEVTKDGH